MADAPDPQANRPAPPGQPETVELAPADVRATPGAAGSPGTLPAPGGAPALAGSFGDYELLGEIERGGMGIVYRARERHSGLLVALKMMLEGGDADQGDRRRFILEARATGELNHAGVVAIHAWGEHEGRPFYTMDFVPGVTLARLLEKGPLPCGRAVRYLLGIAHAVGAAHTLGIVHRDLKPSNVILDLADQPRVLDFGLAKRHRPGTAAADEPLLEALPADAPVPLRAELARRTEKGAILGTPSYMAPEQVRAEHDKVGPPADVHALGAMFYEMVTGRPPFQGESTYDTLLQVVEQPPAPLRRLAPQAPAVLEGFCRRCLHKDPRRRYPNANALAEDLERRWDRSVRAARFARLVLGAGLALLLLAALGFLPRAGPVALVLDAFIRRTAELTPASDPVRRAVPALAFLLGAFVLVLAPYLAELGLLVWLGAWAWNAERPWRIAAACAAGAVAVLALSAGGLEFLRGGPLFLGWLLLVNAGVVLAVVAYRRLSRADRGEAEHRPPSAEPYLQRLFAVRAESRPRAARPREPRALGLADFEPGKTLHRWDDHEVRWARQKSLDRPTLVWLDHAPPGGVVPGVVVRHPAVLGLHAVGATADGSYLVTEPVPASPLSELLAQRGLVPAEAAALTARLARAVQAFHDQGACHGRLGAGWILVRGDLEPVLCPCGFPSQSAEDRARDVLALGRLLREWLPPPSRGWRRRVLAPLYRVADAAGAGAYARAADLAEDVERAVRQVQLRWRERWAHALVLLLLAVPLLFPAAVGLLGMAGVLDRRGLAGLRVEGDVAGWLLLALAPCAALLGYTQARELGHRLSEWRGRRTAWRAAVVGGGLWLPLAEVVLLAAVAAVLAWLNVPAAPAPGGAARGLLLVAGLFAGVWFLGVSAAGLLAYLELLFRSLHAIHPAHDPNAGPKLGG
jgi:serine/threonine-protein kinase